jgi:hypothetical protein
LTTQVIRHVLADDEFTEVCRLPLEHHCISGSVPCPKQTGGDIIRHDADDCGPGAPCVAGVPEKSGPLRPPKTASCPESMAL